MHSREDETQIEALKAELSGVRQVDEASDLEMAGKDRLQVTGGNR